jgi:hypothetical protein
MRAPKRIAVGVTACFIAVPLLLAMVAPVAAAGPDRYVGTTGSDTSDCSNIATPCLTIQYAVGQADPNDTIHVAAGTYPELAAGPLTINKTLTLVGAQVGIDARGSRGAESVISDIQGTSVGASNVTIDGFTVQGSTLAAFTGYGIWLNPGVDGTRIVNNIIQSNIVGIGLANSGSTQAVIRHNLIRNNTLPGGASGTGIYTDQYVGGQIVSNVLIDENSFTGHSGTGGAINISNTDATGGVSGLTVTDNLFDTNSRAFVLFNTHLSTFDGNRINGSTYVGSADIRVFDNNSDLTFTNNDLSNGAGHAARLSFLGAVGGPSSRIAFHYNNFENYALTGLTVDALPSGHVGTVDAECNWWNSATGPTNPNNPGGTGEEVVGNADFTPWLLARAPGGACRGGVPSTPGKVTGGGQTPGTDPRFSAAGNLLSPPAVVLSAASPTANATFGFVVTCCQPKGNLEYNDHQADVRIKVKSIDGLFISDGTCGTNTHATFTGTASVIRSTGTTTESFTVVVDDCGEPGSSPGVGPDMFGIETDSYVNALQPLIGGNIQIHK